MKNDFVNRLARLVSGLDGKRVLLSETTKLVEELQRGELVTVTGEAATIRRLNERLSVAIEILNSLLQPRSGHVSKALLRLEEELDNPDWAALVSLQEELKKKVQGQTEIMRPHLERLAKARSLIDDIKQLLNDGLEAHAPVFVAQRDVQRYEACISAAERALREQQCRLLIQSLDQIPQYSDLEILRNELQTKIGVAIHYSRQADLLLLQSPLDKRQGHYTYMTLLRTASEPGSHGINIQDSITLGEQDRAALGKIIEKITHAIDCGLARKFAFRKSGPPVPPPVGAEVRINALIEDMGDLMFRLIMPDWMPDYLQDTPCSVMITSNDLELPWELLHCNGEYLCLQRPTSRMPVGRKLPKSRPKPAAQDVSKIRFLLIYADPKNDLPAAGLEIETLGRELKEGWKDRIEVVMLSNAEATNDRLNYEFRSGNFDVIHFAGHAAFDEGHPERSGLQVSEGRKVVLYTADKIQRLLGGRPLVFLNACSSARTDNEKEAPQTDFLLKPAGGLASSFLYGGALGCIGTLWPVYDEAAADFALDFYRKALDGYMLGEAMRLARMRSREKYPDQITWAAFALYGDATFRLAH